MAAEVVKKVFDLRCPYCGFYVGLDRVATTHRCDECNNDFDLMCEVRRTEFYHLEKKEKYG